MAGFPLPFPKTQLRMRRVIAVLLIWGAVASGAEPRLADLLKKGDALDAQLKTAEALSVFLEAEKADPKNAEILRRIAKQYGESMVDARSKDEKRRIALTALEYGLRAVDANPRNSMAQLSLAVCYGRAAPFMDAKTKIAYSRLVKEHAEISLGLDKRNDYAYHILGAWHYELANVGAILRGLCKLIYGDLPAASNEQAVEFFLKAIELGPNRVSHHIELGRVYATLGKKDLAQIEIQKGLNLPERERDDPDTKARGRETLKNL